MASNQRKEERYGVSMDVSQNDKSGKHVAKTGDVSRSGLFLCTPVLKPLRSLIQLSIHLPNDPTPISVMAQVAWVNEQDSAASQGPRCGMGVKFFSMNRVDTQRWEAFLKDMKSGGLSQETMNQLTGVASSQPSGVYSLEHEDLENLEIEQELQEFEEDVDEFEIVIDDDFDSLDSSPVTDLSLEAGSLETGQLPTYDGEPLPLEPDIPSRATPADSSIPHWDQRQFSRRDASFLVKMQDQQTLHQFFTINISEGGMFLQTTDTLPVGTTTQLVLIHPWTAEEFPLVATVRRIENKPGHPPGLGIEFDGKTEEQRDAILAFIESGFNLKVSGAVNLIEGALLRIRKLEEKIQQNPIDSELHYGVGLLYLYLKEYSKASEHLDISQRLGFPIPRDIPMPR